MYVNFNASVGQPDIWYPAQYQYPVQLYSRDFIAREIFFWAELPIFIFSQFLCNGKGVENSRTNIQLISIQSSLLLDKTNLYLYSY